MCDYSLCGLPNRLAIEGETLEVHMFPTGSTGLVSAAELHRELAGKPDSGFWSKVKASFAEMLSCEEATVVCMPPGSRLLLQGIPRYFRRKYAVGEVECVKFSEADVNSDAYRDIVQFKNGATAGFQELPEGLQVKVLSLESESRDDEGLCSGADPAEVSQRRS